MGRIGFHHGLHSDASDNDARDDLWVCPEELAGDPSITVLSSILLFVACALTNLLT
jgi:hypothetical protein